MTFKAIHATHRRDKHYLLLILYSAFLLLTAAACGQETGFTELPVPVAAQGSQADASADKNELDTSPQSTDETIPQTADDDEELSPNDQPQAKTPDQLLPDGIEINPEDLTEGSADEVFDDLQNRRRERFSFGDDTRSPLVDYLFVLDNSCSVDPLGAKLSSGFLSLVGSERLPQRSKLAVMSTMIADDNNLYTTGLGINRYNGIDAEPGFLDFVNRDAIANYRGLDTDYRDEWMLAGCEQSWFAPGDRAPEGHYCLEAATQSSNSCLGAEAGIQAFEQLLLKKQLENTSSFREGAVVNVIFVSDTHDPGTDIDSLKESIPAYEELYDLAFSSNVMGGLRFHSLAPSSPCTTEGLHDLSYYKLSDASGGLKTDPCNLTDYQDFLADMVEVSASPIEPRFTLSRLPNQIEAVFVNDTEIKEYEWVGPKTISIPNLDPEQIASIEVIYSYN